MLLFDLSVFFIDDLHYVFVLGAALAIADSLVNSQPWEGLVPLRGRRTSPRYACRLESDVPPAHEDEPHSLNAARARVLISSGVSSSLCVARHQACPNGSASTP